MDACRNVGSICKLKYKCSWDIYVQCGRYMYSGVYASNVNVCIPMILVTLLIALSSYEVYNTDTVV